MKLSKISENLPDWASELKEITKKPECKSEDVIAPLDEVSLTKECDKIGKCASSGEEYCHLNYSSSDLSQLKEYAMACGLPMNKFVKASSTSRNQETIIRTASTASTEIVETVEITLENKLKNVMSDPFHIEERTASKDVTSPDKSDWEKVSLAGKLQDSPKMSGIVPLRGGEDYFTNSDQRITPGRNSITSPDAIEKLANDTTEDSGARLKREKVEKENRKVAEKANWEKEKIDAMPHRNIVSKGTVFPTESMVAQSGLNSPSSQMGVYAKFNPASIPEKTEGEKLAEQNKTRKQSIQRDVVEDNWESPRSQSLRGVSDTFADSLKKFLKK